MSGGDRPGAADAPGWIAESFAATPVTGLLGARVVSWDPERGILVTEYEAGPEFCNLVGTVQGGILTAMLDNAMSYAALARLGPEFRVPSLEIKTSFTEPARPGRLTGEGWEVRRGRQVAFIAGRLLDDAGRLVAAATGTALIRRIAPG